MKPVGKYDVLLNLATGMTNLWDYGISGTKMDQSLHSLSYGRSSVTVTIQGTECQEITPLVRSFPSTKSRMLFDCNEQ